MRRSDCKPVGRIGPAFIPAVKDQFGPEYHLATSQKLNKDGISLTTVPFGAVLLTCYRQPLSWFESHPSANNANQMIDNIKLRKMAWLDPPDLPSLRAATLAGGFQTFRGLPLGVALDGVAGREE